MHVSNGRPGNAGQAARTSLDKPSPPHRITNALIRAALADLAVIAEARAGALAEPTKNGNRSNGRPAGPSVAPDDLFWHRYKAAKTHRQRLQVILAAQTFVRQSRYSPPPLRPIRGTPKWRQAIADDNRPARTVAAFYDTSKDTVLRIKREAGKNVAPRGRPRKV